jgi:transposase InsO family protein
MSETYAMFDATGLNCRLSTLAATGSLAEGLAGRAVVLQSGNGSSMKGATMLATLEKLGIMPSFSRPSVSNDNAYAESLFRTCKYQAGSRQDSCREVDGEGGKMFTGRTALING